MIYDFFYHKSDVIPQNTRFWVLFRMILNSNFECLPGPIQLCGELEFQSYEKTVLIECRYRNGFPPPYSKLLRQRFR